MAQRERCPVTFHQCVPVDPSLRDGCVLPHEQFILNTLATTNRFVGTHALEIGTFTGEMSSNLARAMPDHLVLTVDLPAGTKPSLRGVEADGHYYNATPTFAPDVADRIELIHCDSALLSLPPAVELGFTFIDGAHSREYVLNDFRKALTNSAHDAIIAFHDAGTWPEVGQTLIDIVNATPRWQWFAYAGTSLVWHRVSRHTRQSHHLDSLV